MDELFENLLNNSRINFKNRKRIIPDFRPENNIRLGFSPLYVSFIDLYETVIAIKDILENKEYLKIDDSKPEVT